MGHSMCRKYQLIPNGGGKKFQIVPKGYEKKYRMITKSGKSVYLRAVTMIDPATGWIPSAKEDLIAYQVY